jgi:serine protease Do
MWLIRLAWVRRTAAFSLPAIHSSRLKQHADPHAHFALRFFLAAPFALADGGADFLSLQNRYTELFQDNQNAVVRVKAAYEATSPTEMSQVVIGTGFFISREGHVLTNASVVLNPDRIWVVHKGVEYAARMIGFDKATNLALLKVVTLPKNFFFIQISDNPTLPAPGTMLLRIGCPLELSPSPSYGMVSGVESRYGQHIFPCSLVRTNIPANPGDGGSPFLDLNGRLVGIQVGSISEAASTYILPVRAVMRVRDDLLFSGKVTDGWIGFEVALDTTVADGERVLIRKVIAGTPAEQAGMHAGDQIVQVGLYPVEDLDDLRNALFYTRVDEYVPVKLLRDGRSVEFNVRIAQRPVDADADASLVQPQSEPKPLLLPMPPKAAVPQQPVPQAPLHGPAQQNLPPTPAQAAPVR